MVTTISIIAFLIASYFAVMGEHYKQFKRFLKKGDPVSFFIGEERYYGEVTLIGRKFIHIKTDMITGKLTTYKVGIDNVYPVLRFRYKKVFD